MVALDGRVPLGVTAHGSPTGPLQIWPIGSCPGRQDPPLHGCNSAQQSITPFIKTLEGSGYNAGL